MNPDKIVIPEELTPIIRLFLEFYKMALHSDWVNHKASWALYQTWNAGWLGEGRTIEEYSDNVDSYNEKIKTLQAQYDELAASGADLTDIEYQLSVARIGLTHATEELEQAQEAEKESLTDRVTSAEEQQTRMNAALENAHMAMTKLKAAYDEAYASAMTAALKQFDLFEAVGELAYTSTQDLGANLESQAAYWDGYAANPNYLADSQYGLSQELISFLSDGSKESSRQDRLARNDITLEMPTYSDMEIGREK